MLIGSVWMRVYHHECKMLPVGSRSFLLGKKSLPKDVCLLETVFMMTPGTESDQLLLLGPVVFQLESEANNLQ